MLGGGVVFFFLYQSFVLGPLNASADKAANDLGMEQKNLQAKMASGVPTEDALALAERTLERSKKQLDDLTSDSKFNVDEKFRKPRGERALPYFEDQMRELYKELKKKAVNSRIAFPKNLGLTEEASEESAPEMLLRLAMIDRLVGAAVGARITRITHIDGIYRADRMEDSTFVEGQFLNKVSVFMRFAGPSEAVHKVLHAVQKKEDYLVVSHFEADKPDPTEDRLEAAIGVTMLVVDPKAPIEPSREGEYDD